MKKCTYSASCAVFAGLVLLLSSGSAPAQVRFPEDSPEPPPAKTGAELLELWSHQEVGTAPLGGSVSVPGDGTYVIQGAGADIWDRQDGFQFMHLRLEGDGQVLARVVALRYSDLWAKAGLMIRESTDADARYAMVSATPTNGVIFQSRDEIAGLTTLGQRNLRAQVDDADPTVPTPIAAPCWLRLVRRGDVFRGYASTNGTDWEWVGTTEIPAAATELYVGLAVSSHSETKLSTATFDSVALTLAPTEPPLTASGNGDGLKGTYFNGIDFASVALTRTDPVINFDWGRSAPAAAVPADRFSVRWEGELLAQVTEACAFHVVSDDRARLWINGRLLIDDSSRHPAQESSGTIRMVAGRRYLIRIDFVENDQDAAMQLYWSSPSIPKQIIPQSQLYSQVTDVDRDGMPDLWETAFGFNPADASDAATDPDGDGASNLAEYRNGTNPRRAEARTAGLPAPWVSRDIGQVRVAGQGSAAQGVFSVSGAGADIWANADSFHFVARPFSGDGQIVVRVLAQENTDPWAKAGLMLRETLNDDARHALLALTPENGVTFQHRLEPGGSCTDDPGGPATPPCWLKLVRNGSVIRAFRSSDGARWEWIGSERVVMARDIYAGLAVSSHSPGRVSTALMDSVSVQAADAMGNRVAGKGDGLLGSYFQQDTTNFLLRLDPRVEFDWEDNAPMPGISADNFSVRWVGLIEPQFSEQYAFHLISDDGARLWLDGQMIIDAWSDRAATRMTGRTILKSGHKYSVKVEFYERTGQATLKLLWSSPSLAREIIPQSQLYSPLSPSYSEIEDKDRDGMPDSWEQANGLDLFDAADAPRDADGDGLTNLEEYQAGTDPWKVDTDGDQLTDLWEVRNGLNPIDPSDATLDLDSDGVSNLEEFLAGTDPRNGDTDGDGLSDLMELKETKTNPLVGDIQQIVNVAEIDGSAATGAVGDWVPEGRVIYSKSCRGYVEYDWQVSQANVYRLEIEGASHNPNDANPSFEVLVSVDREYLGRAVLTVGAQGFGLVHQFTPWLGVGSHRVRIFWDNAKWRRSFELRALRIQQLQGSDENQNGVTDWVEARLNTQCGLLSPVVESATSPLCVEGRGAYLSMMSISGGALPRYASKGQWYADVPLLSTGPTTITVSYQNGGLSTTNQIRWKPTNLLETNNPTIRKGDALLLIAAPAGQSDGTMTLTSAGLINYTGSASQPVICTFAQPGVFVVTGTYTPRRGSPQTRNMTVRVVDATLGEDPAVWVGKSRLWECPDLPSDAVLQGDTGLKLSPVRNLPGAGRQLSLSIDAQEPRAVLARLGANGPVLSRAMAGGFRLYSGSETSVRVVQEFEDGSKLVEMGLVLSPLLPPVAVRLDIKVGGIVFDDGSLSRVLTQQDFEPLGEAKVRFVMPASAKTSVCHTTKAFQGSVLLGTRP